MMNDFTGKKTSTDRLLRDELMLVSPTVLHPKMVTLRNADENVSLRR
jgi:hypothetical protein